MTVEFIPTSNDLIQRYNIKWMKGALNYTQAKRGLDGREDLKVKWFKDLNVMTWYKPFFRHLDGYNHSYFCLDIDVALKNSMEEKYKNYPEKKRLFKLGAAINYFKNWKDTLDHEFFWKVSGTGLHALQFIPEKFNREYLVPLVETKFFPPCEKFIADCYDSVNNTYIIEMTEERYKTVHKCNSKCIGWHYEYRKSKGQPYYNMWDLDWVKITKYKDVDVKLKVDLRPFKNRALVVRWTWSPYFKIGGRAFYSIPIEKWDIDWIAEHSVAEGLADTIKEYTIPEFSFWDDVDREKAVISDEKEWLVRESKSRAHGDKNGFHGIVVNLLPTSSEHNLPFELKKTLNQMSAEFTSLNCAPCINQHYRLALTERGRHWSRFPIVRYLASKKFSYSISEIANWIRFKLNDDRDNSDENSWKLMYYLPQVIGDPKNPDRVPNCRLFQNPASDFYICDPEMRKRCGRKHPLQDEPKNTTPVLTKIEAEVKDVMINTLPDDWGEITKLVTKAIKTPEHKIIWKGTRAGVTTTMINVAVGMKKKLLVVVPTNKIAYETFTEAMHLIHEKTGQNISGAVFSSNDKLCLKLQMMGYDLFDKKQKNPTWGGKDRKLAWNELKYHSKPMCQSCKFFESFVEPPLIAANNKPYPIYRSMLTNKEARYGWCAYQSIIRNLDKLDVLFFTYAKIESMFLSNAQENLLLIDQILDKFDLLFLDEISTIAQGSPLQLNIFKNLYQPTTMDEAINYDIISKLKDELREINSFGTNDSIAEMNMYINKFIERFEGLKVRNWYEFNVSHNEKVDLIQDVGSENSSISHPLDYAQREILTQNFSTYHAIIENYAKVSNIALTTIENTLFLLMKPDWIGYNLPMENDVLDYKFVTEPNIRNMRAFVRQFIRKTRKKKVLVTDACLPEVNIADLLGIPLKDFVIGDPRLTNKKQLVASDSSQQNIYDFLDGRSCRTTNCQFWKRNDCNLIINYNHPTKKDVIIHENALRGNNNWCAKNEILFLKNVQSFINGYGSENIMVVMPNIKLWNWFKNSQRKLLHAEDLKLTYFRSDETLGVKSDRRIMITMGSALPPRHSYLWLAYFYHRIGLMNNFPLITLSDKLQENSMKSAFWQTIGRVKDPRSTERSIVYAFGQGLDNLINVFNFHAIMSNFLPHFITVDSRKDSNSFVMDILDFWKREGILISDPFLRIVRYLQTKKSDSWLVKSQIMRLFGYNDEQMAHITKEISSYPQVVFDKFSVEFEINKRGYKQILRIKNKSLLS